MEGERELKLHFPARGNPSAIKYLWSKNGVPLPSNGKRVLVKGHTLLLRDATRDDRGAYSVRAANTEGSAELTFFINILCKCPAAHKSSQVASCLTEALLRESCPLPTRRRRRRLQGAR